MSKPFRADLEGGLELQRAGKLEEAEAIYGRVVALSPNLAEGWHMLGLVRHQQQDFQGAADAINRAITLDSTQAAFFNNYGAALQGVQRCADAVAAYRAALQIRPDYYDAQLNLVRALNQLGQPKPAHALAKQAIGTHPRQSELLQQGVRAAEGAHVAADAVAWLEQLVDLARDHAALATVEQLAAWLLRLGTLLLELRRGDPRAQRAL